MRSRKAATSAPGLGWYRNKSRPETEQSSAAYRNEAIAICAPGLGRVGQGRAKALGALWAQVVDRSSEEATASQRPRHRARQQARPHCLERPGSWANLRG